MLSASLFYHVCRGPSEGKSGLALKAGEDQEPHTTGHGHLQLKHILQGNREEPWILVPALQATPWLTLGKPH